jgi:hypothetical protein
MISEGIESAAAQAYSLNMTVVPEARFSVI